MTSATDFKTPWEAREWAADHGRTAAQAIGQQCYARYLHDRAAEDMALLGITAIPEPRPQMWPVTGGSDEDRKARVDAFATRHGIRAGTDETSGTYRAVLAFGPVTLVVYMIPDRTMADRLAALYSAVREETTS